MSSSGIATIATVYSNYFTVHGTAISVQSGSTSRRVVFDSGRTTGTYYPPKTTSKLVWNKPDLLGITGPPITTPRPSATKTVTEDKAATSTSTQPSNPQPPPANPTAFLDLWFSHYSPIEDSSATNTYEFFTLREDEEISICKDTPAGSIIADSGLDLKSVVPPEMDYTFKSDVRLVGGCRYEATKGKPGVLRCNGRVARQCTTLDLPGVTCTGSQTFVGYKTLVRCAW